MIELYTSTTYSCIWMILEDKDVLITRGANDLGHSIFNVSYIKNNPHFIYLGAL